MTNSVLRGLGDPVPIMLITRLQYVLLIFFQAFPVRM